MKQKKYYHVSQSELGEIIKPENFYEATDKSGLNYWYPIDNVPPHFFESTIPESCFATTIEGALFGYCSDECPPGEYHAYVTEEEPDIDLTDEMVQDFGVIEEVRYRRPVKIRKQCSFQLSKEVADLIQSCQIETDDGSFFNDECGFDVKDKLRKWLEKDTECYNER